MRKVLVFLALVISLLSPNNVYANGDLSVSLWSVDARLLENGDLAISEDITYNFKSDFNGIYRDIALKGTDGIEGLKIFEIKDGERIEYSLKADAKKGQNRVYKSETKNNTLNLMIFSPSKKEEKVFRFEYSLKNIAIRHSDTGELYFKFIGQENETAIDSFRAFLSLPEFNERDIRIFAHGPLNGRINFTPESNIKMEVNKLASKTFIEARVLFPKEYISLSKRDGQSSLRKILDEERALIEKKQEDIIKKEKTKKVLNTSSLGLSGLGAILLSFTYSKFRRDPYLYDNLKDLNLDKISPAELSLFMNLGLGTRKDLATLFDLTRRGFLTIEEIHSPKKNKTKKVDNLDFLFKKNDYSGPLLDFERYFLDWILNDMGNGLHVSTLDMVNYRKNFSSSYFKKYNKLNKMISNQLKSRNYYHKKASKFGVYMIVLGFVFAISSIISISLSAYYGIMALILSLIILVYGVFLLQRTNDKGYVQKHLWKQFKKDFEQFNVNDYFDRDESLIYAIALGLPMKELNSYRTSIASSYYPMYWGHWFFMTNNRGGSIMEDNFNHSFYGSTGTSTASSLGSGGGFTAGGGGGAGGGGTGGF